MQFELISVARERRLTVITIERPEVHNALNAQANREMSAAFDAFAADEDQWVAIVTGAGNQAFCAGHDLKQQALGGGFVIPSTGFAGLTTRFDLTKPVIAAVNGLAFGGGFEIALACDLVVASENATFALPEPLFGLAALMGGVQRLPREIGLKRAMGMLLTGRRVGVQEAVAMGFVNEVADDALATARRWAEEILRCSPMSVRATKQAVMAGLAETLPAAFASAQTHPAVQAMVASQDLIEGPAAFAQKRSPQWRGC